MAAENVYTTVHVGEKKQIVTEDHVSLGTRNINRQIIDSDLQAKPDGPRHLYKRK